MNIPEAIKINNSVGKGSVIYTDSKIRKAARLGSEALKFIKGLRDNGAMPVYALLPGETEE